MSNELTTLGELNPIAVFKGGLDEIINKIEEEVRAVDTDISTTKGRQEIASLARKVASSKTAIDKVGKDLGEEYRGKLKGINADRKKSWERLEALQHEIRQPLTDFENMEKERIAEREARITAMASLISFEVIDPSVDTIQANMDQLNKLSSFEWQEFEARAEQTMQNVYAKLDEMKTARIKADKEKAELERLRAEEEARKKKEREEQIAREAADRARVEAEKKAEAERRAAEEKAARERKEAEERAAEEKAAREEAEKREKESAERAKRAAIVAEIEAAERADREKRAAIAAERKRVADEKAREDAAIAKREADKKHRAKINNEAKDAINEVVNDEELSKLIVSVIAQGKIPNVKIIY